MGDLLIEAIIEAIGLLTEGCDNPQSAFELIVNQKLPDQLHHHFNLLGRNASRWPPTFDRRENFCPVNAWLDPFGDSEALSHGRTAQTTAIKVLVGVICDAFNAAIGFLQKE